jgi:hypothetical protein
MRTKSLTWPNREKSEPLTFTAEFVEDWYSIVLVTQTAQALPHRVVGMCKRGARLRHSDHRLSGKML